MLRVCHVILEQKFWSAPANFSRNASPSQKKKMNENFCPCPTVVIGWKNLDFMADLSVPNKGEVFYIQNMQVSVVSISV